MEGDNQNELVDGLAALKKFAGQASSEMISTGQAAARWYRQCGHNPYKRLGAALTAKNFPELETYIRDAEKAVHTDTLIRIGIRGGAAYSPEPLGREAETAFVFPGSGNHYLGMRRESGLQWPEILRPMDQKTGYLKNQLLPECFMPRWASRPPDWERQALKKLESNPFNMIIGQVVHDGFVSNIVRSFGVHTDAAIGYSLGESAAT